MAIHPTAIIEKEVEIAEGVTIGPYSVISGRTKIGRGTRIENHVTIGSPFGRVEIGEDNDIYPGAVLGVRPQDLSYKGEDVSLEVGNKNIIRECVTLNLGTKKGTGVTKIGNNNLIMAYTHLGHDSILEDNIVITNSGQFAGHIHIHSNVRIGGICGIAQFVKIGRYAYIGGASPVNKDILPFTIAQGFYARSRATNKIGLERAGFTTEQIANINRAVRFVIMGERTMDEAIQKIEAECNMDEHIRYMIDFIRTSQQGIAR